MFPLYKMAVAAPRFFTRSSSGGENMMMNAAGRQLGGWVGDVVASTSTQDTVLFAPNRRVSYPASVAREHILPSMDVVIPSETDLRTARASAKVVDVPGAGKGVFARVDLKRDALVCVYPGRVYRRTAWERALKRGLVNNVYAVDFFRRVDYASDRDRQTRETWIVEDLVLDPSVGDGVDPMFRDTIGPFLNEPNDAEQNCYWVFNIDRGTLEMRVFKNVPAGGELTICYGNSYARTYQSSCTRDWKTRGYLLPGEDHANMKIPQKPNKKPVLVHTPDDDDMTVRWVDVDAKPPKRQWAQKKRKADDAPFPPHHHAKTRKSSANEPSPTPTPAPMTSPSPSPSPARRPSPSPTPAPMMTSPSPTPSSPSVRLPVSDILGIIRTHAPAEFKPIKFLSQFRVVNGALDIDNVYDALAKQPLRYDTVDKIATAMIRQSHNTKNDEAYAKSIRKIAPLQHVQHWVDLDRIRRRVLRTMLPDIESFVEAVGPSSPAYAIAIAHEVRALRKNGGAAKTREVYVRAVAGLRDRTYYAKGDTTYEWDRIIENVAAHPNAINVSRWPRRQSPPPPRQPTPPSPPPPPSPSPPLQPLVRRWEPKDLTNAQRAAEMSSDKRVRDNEYHRREREMQRNLGIHWKSSEPVTVQYQWRGVWRTKTLRGKYGNPEMYDAKKTSNRARIAARRPVPPPPSLPSPSPSSSLPSPSSSLPSPSLPRWNAPWNDAAVKNTFGSMPMMRLERIENLRRNVLDGKLDVETFMNAVRAADLRSLLPPETGHYMEDILKHYDALAKPLAPRDAAGLRRMLFRRVYAPPANDRGYIKYKTLERVDANDNAKIENAKNEEAYAQKIREIVAPQHVQHWLDLNRIRRRVVRGVLPVDAFANAVGPHSPPYAIAIRSNLDAVAQELRNRIAARGGYADANRNASIAAYTRTLAGLRDRTFYAHDVDDEWALDTAMNDHTHDRRLSKRLMY